MSQKITTSYYIKNYVDEELVLIGKQRFHKTPQRSTFVFCVFSPKADILFLQDKEILMQELLSPSTLMVMLHAVTDG